MKAPRRPEVVGAQRFGCRVDVVGNVLETVLTGPSPRGTTLVVGGPTAEIREIFRQLDKILA